MNQKPIIKIDKFTGSGEGGILYNEGFYPELDNGLSVMGEGFSNYNIVNYTTTGYTNIGNVMSILGLSTFSTRDKYILFLNSNGRFFSKASITGVVDKEIHLNSTTSTLYPCMVETSNSNILYTSQNYIGRGVRGKATGGSTTTLVDYTRNFTTLGYAANDKVTNLKTGIEYTINSISQTINPGDTLNFTASGTNTNTADDEFIAWEDNKLDITSTVENWQPIITSWNRQIKQYGSQYLFGNGNYLGMVSADEATVDKTYKQLPLKHQLLAFDINVSMVLVSAEFNGKGVLCLWDGYSDGWNNVLELDSPIPAIIKYKSGWVYVVNGEVFYTDGYQIQRLSALGNSSYLSQHSLQPAMYNSLSLYRGFLYCASISNDLNLLSPGVYIIDLNNTKNGWTFVKCKLVSRNNGYSFSLFLVNIFEGYQRICIGGSGSVNALYIGTDASYSNKSLIMMVSLPEYKKISGIGLNVSRYLKDYNNDVITASFRDIQVSIGDGNRGLIALAQTKSLGAPTNDFVFDGTSRLNNEVGDELLISDTSQATFDERTFITGITGKGTATETWTTSPALSTTHTDGTNIKMIRVKKLDKVRVNYNDLKKEIMFYSSGLETNKLFIEVVVYGNNTAFPLSINEIKVYGN